MFLFSFSVALLAGMGLQWLRDSRKDKSDARSSTRLTYLLVGLPALMLLLALLFAVGGKGVMSAWCSLFFDEAGSRHITQTLTKLDLAYMNLPAIQSGAWLAFLFTSLAALFIWLYRSGKAGIAILMALIAIVAIDGIRFNLRFVDTMDAEEYWRPSPVAEFIKQRMTTTA
jgi:hypothetical protein